MGAAPTTLPAPARITHVVCLTEGAWLRLMLSRVVMGVCRPCAAHVFTVSPSAIRRVQGACAERVDVNTHAAHPLQTPKAGARSVLNHFIHFNHSTCHARRAIPSYHARRHDCLLRPFPRFHAASPQYPAVSSLTRYPQGPCAASACVQRCHARLNLIPVWRPDNAPLWRPHKQTAGRRRPPCAAHSRAAQPFSVSI